MRFLKVYGIERSGTNLLEKIIQDNFQDLYVNVDKEIMNFLDYNIHST
jgi:hypothetical protein